MKKHPLIYCALDTNDLERALFLAKTVGPVTKGLKLGLEFFNAFGPAGLEAVMKAAPGADYFIDLKYHDIPNTVAGAVKALSRAVKPAYLNVHAAGGLEMMRAAKKACLPETRLLGVTILTSLSEEDLYKTGYRQGLSESVRDLALLAQEAGLDGVVCAAHEIEMLRKTCGPDFILMVPGIRPEGAKTDDQKRVMSPAEALRKGAHHLVIGRPVTAADDPALAAQKILDTVSA